MGTGDSQGTGRPQGTLGTDRGEHGDPSGPSGDREMSGNPRDSCGRDTGRPQGTLTEAEVLAGDVAKVLGVQEPVPRATQELTPPVAQVDQDAVGQHDRVPHLPAPRSPLRVPGSHPRCLVSPETPGSLLDA